MKIPLMKSSNQSFLKTVFHDAMKLKIFPTNLKDFEMTVLTEYIKKLGWCLLITSCWIDDVQSVNFNNNSAVLVNGSLHFICSTSENENENPNFLNLEWTPDVRGEQDRIATVTGLWEPFLFDTSFSSINSFDNPIEYIDVRIYPVYLNHAGVYSCLEADKDARADACVTVLENPSCEMVPAIATEHADVILSCNVRYSGPWSPVVTCFDSNSNRITSGASNQTTATMVIYNVTVKAEDGEIFNCVTKFEERSLSSRGCAGNVPTFEHHQNISLNVSFKPRNVSMRVGKSSNSSQWLEVNSNNVLECLANGNPKPSFYFDCEMLRFNVSELKINEIFPQNDGLEINCTCVAVNLYGLVSSPIYRIRILNAPTTYVDTTTNIYIIERTNAVIIPIGVGVIVFGVIASLIIMRKRANRRFSNKKTTNITYEMKLLRNPMN